MSRRRFFTDPPRSGIAELHGEEARHLTRVLRVEPGQQFEISDNQRVYLAEVQEARGERVAFRILEPIESPEPPVRITLCAALVKFDRFEWTVEKATELGVERILPVETARSEKGLFEASRKRSERWRRIARESAQQSRRVHLPEIAPAVRFAAAIETAAAHRYFFDEAGARPLAAMLPASRTPGDTVAVLIGPEGGWTEAERTQAAVAAWQPASLGPQILRAETAAVAALSVIVSTWLAL